MVIALCEDYWAVYGMFFMHPGDKATFTDGSSIESDAHSDTIYLNRPDGTVSYTLYLADGCLAAGL